MDEKCSVVRCKRSSRIAMNKLNVEVVSTADVIALYKGKIVLIQRKKFPLGLALPGGHVEFGERASVAALREFKEETGLVLTSHQFFTKRSGSKRDPRYAISKTRVYTGQASGEIRDEAGCTEVVLFSPLTLRQVAKERFAFDHHQIVMDYLKQ